MPDALHTGGTGADGRGVTSARDARLAQAGLLALQGPTAIDTRTGVLPGPGSTNLVTGTGDTAPMAYNVAPHHWVTSRRAVDGPYLGALDAVRKVPTTVAPASGSRIDVIYVRQADNDPTVLSPDATTTDVYGVLQGVTSPGTPQKPSPLPAGALELAVATVGAGATATNGAGVTITQTVRHAATRGGLLLVRNADERTALTGYPTLQVLELDTKRRYVHDGAGWKYAGGSTPAVMPISLANGWTAAAGLGVTIDASGIKHLTGWISNTTGFTPGGGEIIGFAGALPEGYRPVNALFPLLPVSTAGAMGVQVNINIDGSIVIARPIASPISAGAFWDVNHVTFL